MYNSCLLELQSCWLVLALEFLRWEKSLSADDPGDQTLDRGEGLGVPDQAGEGVEHRVLGVLTNCPGRQEQPSPGLETLGQMRDGEGGKQGNAGALSHLLILHINHNGCVFHVSFTSPSLRHLHHLLRSFHLDLIEGLHEGVPGRGNLWRVVDHDGEDDLGSCGDLRAEWQMVSLGEVTLQSSAVGQTDVVTLRGFPVHGALDLGARNSGHLVTVASLRVLNIQDLDGGGGDERKEERENNGLNSES